jgi:hypothetical protein
MCVATSDPSDFNDEEISLAEHFVQVFSVVGVPMGFRSPEEFLQFGDRLYGGLFRAGHYDAHLVMQGSAVTNRSHDSGQPFGRNSDYDVAIASRTLYQGGQNIKIDFRADGSSGPLTPAQRSALGIEPILADTSRSVGGRTINVRLFETPSGVYSRGGIYIPYSITNAATTSYPGAPARPVPPGGGISYPSDEFPGD